MNDFTRWQAKMTEQKTQKDAFLKQALENVPFDGWTTPMLETTAEQLSLTTSDVADLFPLGIKDLLVYFGQWVNDEMLTKAETEDLESMKIRERIHWLVQTRLEILSPYKASVKKSLNVLIMPRNVLLGPKFVWESADQMWIKAGDTATDYNRYTKRGLLSGVIVSTTLYWLNDTSDHHEKTWRFLTNRINNVLTLGGFIQKVKSTFSGCKS